MRGKQKFVNNLVARKLVKQWQAPEIARKEKEKVLKLLNEFIFCCAIDEFNDGDAIIFAEMYKNNKPEEEKEAFAQERIPDYDEFIKGVFAEFRELYLTTQIFSP